MATGALAQAKIIRFDLSPKYFIHVPQAPTIERRAIFSRDEANPWEMQGTIGILDGRPVGLSNHTWSHLDAPFHLFEDGESFDQIEPRKYLVSWAKVIDLTGTEDASKRETIEAVNYHSIITPDELPSAEELAGYDALLILTGFSALIDRKYPMREGADEHYPNVSREAAELIASYQNINLVGIDSPSFDKPHTKAIAHRILLGRRPNPIYLLETLSTTRLAQHAPKEVMLTVEPLRADRLRADGALCSVYAYSADDNNSLLRELTWLMKNAEIR